MVDPDRRPTAQEIEELIDLVRRDPASPAFIDLGEAYLALGRPRDALQVGNLGLEASPDNLEGRVMLARAYAALHQWKEAQGELLRVVKVDRSNRQGFALLGEVLLRRSDYERAVPVLQHAQNLDPTSPQILAMLRRARAGQALDPPPPVPQPIPPRGETENTGLGALAGGAQPFAPQRAPLPRPMQQPMAAAPMPMAMPAAPVARAPQPLTTLDALVGNNGAPVPPMPRAPKQTAPPPPPMSVEGVKPRIIATVKQQNAAAASLRQSAAVGENYLNDLLTGGLLDVAGVRVPEANFDLRPDRRWGRSTRRAFIFLFVILVFGIGGGGTWYWYTENQKAEKIAKLREEAQKSLGTADYTSFVDSLRGLNDAINTKADKTSFAYFVQSGGFAILLYGEVRIPDPNDPSKPPGLVSGSAVDSALLQLTKSEEYKLEPEDPEYREMVLGRVALDLARLPPGLEKPEAIAAAAEKLGDDTKSIEELLTRNDGDKWARWLRGRIYLATGDRTAAAKAFKLAAEEPNGLVVASIDQGNMALDEGRYEDATKTFQAVLERPDAKKHVLATLGLNMAAIEGGTITEKTIGELGTAFSPSGADEAKLPTRLIAYYWYLTAAEQIATDDYASAADSLHKAYLPNAAINRKIVCRGEPSCTPHPVTEPRFWARLGFIHTKLGRADAGKTKLGRIATDIGIAGEVRKNCTWYSKKADNDPSTRLLDAALLDAAGLPDKVIEITDKLKGTNAKTLEVRALVDLNKSRDAVTLAEDVAKATGIANDKPCARDPDAKRIAFELKAHCEMALALSNEKERTDALRSLDKLASGNTNQLPQSLFGAVHLALKDAPQLPTTREDSPQGTNLAFAESQLKKADRDQYPRPLSYRTLAALADIALGKKETDEADKLLERALATNPGYFPALALRARLVLAKGDADKALELLEPILKEQAAITTNVLLTFAEARALRKASPKDKAKDRDEIAKLLGELKGKPGVTDEELGRIAALVDEKLPEELGVPAPESDDPTKKPDKKDPKKKPRRR